MLRHLFGLALGRRLGGFSTLNAADRLLVLSSRSIGHGQVSGGVNPRHGRTGPNTCRQATRPSRKIRDAATAGHEIGAPIFAEWNPKSRDSGKGNTCMLKPRRGKLSPVKTYVTPLPGVGWLQACGRTTSLRRPFHPIRYMGATKQNI